MSPEQSRPDRASITIRLSQPLHDQLRTAADERQLSPSLLAERALADYLARLVPIDEVLATRPIISEG